MKQRYKIFKILLKKIILKHFSLLLSLPPLSLSYIQDYSLYRYNMSLWYMPHESVLVFVGNLEVKWTPCHMFMNWWRLCLTYKKFFSLNTRGISWLFWELISLNALMLSVLPCHQSSELQDGLQNQPDNHNSIFILHKCTKSLKFIHNA